jgi:nifR3 family TIM-barrel protein
MVKGFWKKIKKPVFVLAPMANVTDAAFRHIIAIYGKPDVMWTEFVAVDGLCSKEGRKELLIDFKYSEIERPIVAQIFGSKPENFYEAAQLIAELGFDGIDINMGCPDKNVTSKQKAGAALIQTPELAVEIIKQTKKGAGKLPVSVKTRLGYNKNVLDTWLKTLLETDLAAITLHARTKKEMSDVPAHWEEIKKAVEIRDAFDSSKNKTLIIGNGDVKNLAEANIRVQQTGCDGVMIGRGIFGNPWLFNTKIDSSSITIQEKLRVMLEHTFLFDSVLGNKKSLMIMKKHYKAYVNGFDGAKELRIKLMEAETLSDIKSITSQFIDRLSV